MLSNLVSLRHLLPAVVLLSVPLVATAQCPNDDALEDNDACSLALPLAPGVYPNLVMLQGDDGWFRITLPPGTDMVVDATFTHVSTTGDIDMRMFASDCSTAIDQAGTATDNEQMHFTNITAAPFDVLVQVLGYGTGFTCNTYMLSVAITPTANGCLSSTDDIYEPNDSCASAPILPFGMYMGLIASKDPNPDWYALLVPGGTAIDVQLQYPPDVQANVELRLYEDCNDSPIATGDGVGGALVVSFQNFSALAQTYYIKVNIWSFAQLDCNSYELGLTLVGGNMFTNYCAGDGTAATCPCGNLGGGGEGSANSSGGGAKLSATGTNFVQLDDMRLDARGLLPGQPALLFSGENAPGSGQGVPFGDGLRCAGTNVIRHGVPSPEALGEAAWPAGLVAQNGWGAGDQRHFQVWYRDPVGSACGAGFNLSSAVETTFVP